MTKPKETVREILRELYEYGSDESYTYPSEAIDLALKKLKEMVEGEKKSGCGVCESNCLTDDEFKANQAIDKVASLFSEEA